jgi:hypothetical protein
MCTKAKAASTSRDLLKITTFSVTKRMAAGVKIERIPARQTS